MLDTYTNLKTTIASLLMRDDLDDFIPDWVTLAEASIRRLLKSQASVVSAFLPTSGSASDRYEALPGDFYELVGPPRINTASGSRPLDYVTPLVMDDLWTDTETGTPRFFTIVGARMQFYPQPAAEEIEISYRQGVIALATAAGGVTPLLLEAPDIYLYGALLHSAPYIREDERMPMWKEMYTAALADFNAAHLRKRFTGGPLVMRPRRVIG